MAHGNAVIDGNGIEFRGKAPQLFDEPFDILAYFVKMHMARNELRERIDNGNYRLSELRFFHSVGPPQTAGASHAPALGSGRTAKLERHAVTPLVNFNKKIIWKIGDERGKGQEWDELYVNYHKVCEYGITTSFARRHKGGCSLR
jgi:hypothetical protein